MKSSSSESKSSCHFRQFCQFYLDQNIVPPAESESFAASLTKELPTTFWFNSFDPKVSLLEKKLEQVSHEYASNIRWLPESENGWKVQIPRINLRKDPNLSELHELLINFSETGIITRQEEVSMIPPFFLEITDSDRCLDLCASPGSKTSQILNFLSRIKGDQGARASGKQYSIRGLVVANEINTKRADLLINRLKRFGVMFPHCIFTNHDATTFPSLFLESGVEFLFDKVLCDVPCTGDGTIRKNKNVMRKWSPLNAYELNPLQLKIAKRAVELLAVGGRLVYSTCSLNPIENEAVIYHLIKSFGTSIRLLDMSKKFDRLKFRPGMCSWSVLSTNEKKNIPLSSFPPPHDEVGALNLHYTMRILPHDMDTGGFFIAVLQKFAPSQEVMKECETDLLHANPYFSCAQPIVQNIQEFYGTTGSGDLIPSNNLFFRMKEACTEQIPTSSIVLVSDSVREVLKVSSLTWKIMNVGLRVFSKDKVGLPNGCGWRPVQESTEISCCWFPSSPRLISLNRTMTSKIFAAPLQNIRTDECKDDLELFNHITKLGPGGVYVRLTRVGSTNINETHPEQIVVAGLRGHDSVQLCIDLNDLLPICVLLGISTPYARKKRKLPQ